MAMMPIPSVSSTRPKLKRATAEWASIPISPIRSPSRIMAMAFSSEPLASTTAPSSPTTISEKYSAGPNFSATAASGIAKAAISRVPMVPAMKLLIAAAESAAPARPFRAIL